MEPTRFLGRPMIMWPTPIARAFLVACILATPMSCGEPQSDAGQATQDPRAGDSPAPNGDSGTYVANGTVLQTADGEPQLCLGAIMDSLPPQCEGIPLEGWDWSAVDDEDAASGTRWGSYRVTGTYDGSRFTLTEPAEPPVYDDPGGDEIVTPCPEPPGGWEPDGGQEDVQEAADYARAEPDFAGLWVDQIGEPTEFSPVVLTVAFTGDLAAHEAELQQRWDGPLCVTQHEHTLDELMEIQAELSGKAAEELGLDVLTSSTSENGNFVEIYVTVMGPDTQAELDERYGPGTVKVDAALKPVR